MKYVFRVYGACTVSILCGRNSLRNASTWPADFFVFIKLILILLDYTMIATRSISAGSGFQILYIDS